MQRAHDSSIVDEELVELASLLQSIVEKHLSKAKKCVSYLEPLNQIRKEQTCQFVYSSQSVFAVPRDIQFSSKKEMLYLRVDGLQLLCQSGVSMVPLCTLVRDQCGAAPYR